MRDGALTKIINKIKKYSKGKFKIEEIEAKENNVGLWRTKFDYPWIWRKNNK